MDALSGRLTTHVLDTARGRPAAGIPIELARLDGDRREVLRRVAHQRRRAHRRAAARGELEAGDYELIFEVGEHFGERAFLDRVPVRFTIADAGAHYHVPLLVSPWSYSTYRGS